MMVSDRRLISEVVRLLRPFWPIAVGATLAGLASGLATAWLLATINDALHAPEGATPSLLTAFAGLCLVAVLGEVVSDLGNSFVGQQVVAGLRKDLTDRILTAPIAQIERFRSHRLVATLNHDVEVVSGFTFAFSSLAIALAITVGGLCYLVVLSPATALIAGGALASGIALHARARGRGRAGFEAARELQDELQQHYRAISEGAKELRIHRGRRLHMRDVRLAGTIDRIRDLRVQAMRIYMSANALGSGLFFLVIGLLLTLQAGFPMPAETLSGFVLVLLYIKGPLQQLVGALPAIGQAQVALHKLAALREAFTDAEGGLLTGGIPPVPAPRRIELHGVTYAFRPLADEVPAFAVGPLDLTIRAGDVVFIVGDNGSGKTTLVKLLLGLYEPHAGTIRVNGVAVTSATRDAYRQFFTPVFVDYFLFEDLSPRTVPPGEVDRHLQRLELADKVAVHDGRFTTTDLSTGQRKRLALIQAYLEERPVVVFDEWAADQDPAFRRIFYAEILAELKAQGKTLIVISHDDRYFQYADHVIRMENGGIVEIIDPRHLPQMPPMDDTAVRQRCL
ncbi:cyclic peptide export ABC transporter [Ancylobacter sp. Lp-2]|uniref:cyclic peptide export ABC transporter n=1 Tax=Ancylobacter sp. Lp-2 TaxID=2881339 RepID=UPI001E5016BB|nr:cyclic peptide export ABC transporter [Ancylobacter sp. Lp-2]MCB4768624.1 cyclic peptide export ABC transporter [Ancylobacter sp. Lp-2]